MTALVNRGPRKASLRKWPFRKSLRKMREQAMPFFDLSDELQLSLQHSARVTFSRKAYIMLLAVTAPGWVLLWHPINTCHILRSHCRHLCRTSVSLVSLLAPWKKRLDLIHLCNNNSSNSCYSMPDPVPKVLLQSSHCSYPLLQWRN